MKFYSIFRAGETFELAGGNLNFRLWPMFANDVIDKELISKIYKQLIQLNIKKQTTQSDIE